MAQQFERRFINDYIRENLIDRHYQVRQWLGKLPAGSEDAVNQPIGRWADLIVFDPFSVTIIEAKLYPDPKAIGQLEVYSQMFVQTPRFQQYWKLPIKKVLLTTRLDDDIKTSADLHNIEYKIFRPSWIEFWEKRKFRL